MDFVEICAFGSFDEAKQLYLENEISLDIINESFVKCGIHNKLDVMKWLYTVCNADNISDAFHYACINSHFDTAKWVFSLGKINDDQIKDSFSFCCSRENNQQIIEWLEFEVKPFEYDYDKAFWYACYFGNITTAKWLVSLEKVNIHHDDDNAFCAACSGGNIDIVRWLLLLGNVNINSRQNPFRDACKYGHTDIVNLLILLGVNIHKNNDCAFRESPKEIAEILIKSGGININADSNKNSSALARACMRNDLITAKWLVSIGCNTKYIKNNYSSLTRNESIIEWINTL